MDNQNSGSSAQQSAPTQESKRTRTVSGISYPYFDLGQSVEVANQVYTRGGGKCDLDQLAAWLNYKTVRSGTFITRISAAKQFGLISSSGNQISTTELAGKILAPVMPEDAANAKADAFLNVALFEKVYEKFRGGGLPPKVGLLNLFRTEFRILPDRADPAVRVFLNSAEQAGFFAHGSDRLIRPVGPAPAHPTTTAESKREPTPPATATEKPKGGGGGEGPPGVHSAIIGLLRELPQPGSPWTKAAKTRFKAAFSATLDFIYPDDEEEQ